MCKSLIQDSTIVNDTRQIEILKPTRLPTIEKLQSVLRSLDRRSGAPGKYHGVGFAGQALKEEKPSDFQIRDEVALILKLNEK